jgi:hypothetical protein
VKANIEVADRKEADAIRSALEDPVTRALVVTIGALKQLPTRRARERVLNFVMERLAEEDEAGAKMPELSPMPTRVT